MVVTLELLNLMLLLIPTPIIDGIVKGNMVGKSKAVKKSNPSMEFAIKRQEVMVVLEGELVT